MPTISVITATKNAGRFIAGLYESLRHQTYTHFEWIVVDGRSDDSTIQQLQTFSRDSPWLRYITEDDSGLYDAINKGIRVADGRYYVVAGADDVFNPWALEEYWKAAQPTDADVVLAKVVRNGLVIGGFHPRRAWLGHSKAFRGSHSVGMLFRRSLHATYGPYSKRFPLLADGYFLKLILRKGQVRFIVAPFVAGTFAHDGISSTSKLQTLVETWHIQMLTEEQKIVQVMLFFFKVLIKYPSVSRELKALDHGLAKNDAAD